MNGRLHPKALLKRGLQRLGLDVVARERACPSDVDSTIADVWSTVRPYTMTSAERIVSLCNATDYISQNRIPGAIVECGVWRGGSIMAALMRLSRASDTNRDVYLYDTFSGLTEPSERDVAMDGRSAREMLGTADRSDDLWCVASLDEVKQNIARTGYPPERIHYVEGRVEETLRTTVPGEIALLRLDTDWYESTKVELETLYPKLAIGGVLIIDDYGYWEGARGAVDEFIAAGRRKLLLSRIDGQDAWPLKSSLS